MDRTKRRLISEASVVGIAVAIVGVVYGALSVDAGLPVWFASVLGIFVLAASSEMLFVGILASGGSPWIAALASLTVNTRHLPYGLAVKDILDASPRRLWLIHFVNDESVAFAGAQRDATSRRFAFIAAGLGILFMWPVGALIGSFVGRAFDVAVIGLDAMFPAVILALVIESFRSGSTRYGCLVGAAVAVGCDPFVPQGVAPVLALLALPLMRRPSADPAENLEVRTSPDER